MTAKNVLITGRPGIGKTTAVLKVAEELRRRGFKVGGMVSREERAAGRRVGFVIEDLMTGKTGYLAKVGSGPGPRVGRYTVILSDLESVGVGAIRRAVREADVVVIDEIGPMELYSEEFKRAVLEALNSPKPVLATIHIRANRYPFTQQILSRRDVRLITLTLSNRDRVPREVAEEVARLAREVRAPGKDLALP